MSHSTAGLVPQCSARRLGLPLRQRGLQCGTEMVTMLSRVDLKPLKPSPRTPYTNLMIPDPPTPEGKPGETYKSLSLKPFINVKPSKIPKPFKHPKPSNAHSSSTLRTSTPAQTLLPQHHPLSIPPNSQPLNPKPQSICFTYPKTLQVESPTAPLTSLGLRV